MERTLIIMKPDAVKKKHIGQIFSRIESEGFEILAFKYLWLSTSQAENFYAVHKERPFFAGLIKFMTSGPVVVSALRCENAVEKWRNVIGATDPAEAGEGTIRKLFAGSKQENAVHGSDSSENGIKEVAFFFPESELVV